MPETVLTGIEEIRSLLKDREKAGGTLEGALKKARRRLPRRIFRQGMRLVQAEPLLAHPKLRLTQDIGTLQGAVREVKAYLTEIDVADRRKGLILGVLGSMAFAVLVVLALLVLVLRWRGFI